MRGESVRGSASGPLRIIPLLAALILLAPALMPVALADDAGPSFARPAFTIRMNDGVELSARLWTPHEATTLLPTILLLHGWAGSKETFDELGPIMAAEGYNVLAYDARGFGASEGVATLAGPREIADLKAVITWTITSNLAAPRGIAVTGISYGAAQAWQIAAEDPRVKTVIPVAGWTNLSHSLTPAGILKLSYALALYGTGFDPSARMGGNYDESIHRWAAQLISGVGDAEAQRAFWARSVDTRVGRINANDVSVFAIQGWTDRLFPVDEVLSVWDHLTVKKKAGFGGIGHPPADSRLDSPEATYWLGVVLKWVDEELRGATTDVLTGGTIEVAPSPWDDAVPTTRFADLDRPRVTYMGNFREELRQGVPPTTAPILVKVLANTYAIGAPDDPVIPTLEAAARGESQSSMFEAYPRATPVDTHTFTTSPLANDIEILGSVRLVLPQVISFAPRGQFVVRVYSVTSDETVTLRDVGIYASGIQDVGVNRAITITTWGHHHTYAKDEKIRVTLSAEAFPQFLPEKNPTTAAIFFDALNLPTVSFPIA